MLEDPPIGAGEYTCYTEQSSLGQSLREVASRTIHSYAFSFQHTLILLKLGFLLTSRACVFWLTIPPKDRWAVLTSFAH
jgi:hypothetical protein